MQLVFYIKGLDKIFSQNIDLNIKEYINQKKLKSFLIESGFTFELINKIITLLSSCKVLLLDTELKRFCEIDRKEKITEDYIYFQHFNKLDLEDLPNNVKVKGFSYETKDSSFGAQRSHLNSNNR